MFSNVCHCSSGHCPTETTETLFIGTVPSNLRRFPLDFTTVGHCSSGFSRRISFPKDQDNCRLHNCNLWITNFPLVMSEEDPVTWASLGSACSVTWASLG
jgi:hypothetical protein